jgi:hypothetical protein
LQGASEETCRLSFEHCFHLGDDLRRLAHHLSRKRLKLRAAYSIGFPAALFHPRFECFERSAAIERLERLELPSLHW